MDILSDVNISGNLKTSGSITLGGLGDGAYSTIRAGNIEGYAGVSIEMLSVGKMKIVCGFDVNCGGSCCTIFWGDVIFKNNNFTNFLGRAHFCNGVYFYDTVDFTDANIIGLKSKKNYTLSIPINCTKFYISNSIDYENPVPVESFLKDGNNWKMVQLDYSFDKLGSELSLDLIGSISTPFSEEKTLHFIVG